MSEGPQGIKFMFRALAYRNYRYFFIGQGISLIGTWMQQVALGWLVYRLTSSPFLLGAVAFCAQVPTFILSPFAGLVADRYSKYRIMIVTQSLSLLQASALAALVLTDTVHIYHILFLAFFLGLVNSFDVPARQSFVIEMVENKDVLSNAIALNSSIFNGARLIGPSVAGSLIAKYGEGICFTFNAVSYLAVIVSLLLMNITPKAREAKKKKALSELKEGFLYVYQFVPVRLIIMFLITMSLSGMNYVVLMPVFSRDVLHGSSVTLGYLMSSTGVGALAGAIFLASRRNATGLDRVIFYASILFGSGLIAFSMSRAVWLSMSIMLFTGFGMIVMIASCNTLIQTVIDDDKRGRVMSIYSMSFIGMAPFGSLIAGAAAARIGAPAVLFIGGALCVMVAAVFRSRSVYIRRAVRRSLSRAAFAKREA